ncbi:MAG: BlaI/MecI/CopY family transcriptional regulator [Candidatus Eiseniibacteriota bacterium]|jgi:predicted transcriptional regulator
MSAEHQLSGLQLAVMRELWQRGEATVAEVHAALRESRGLAVTTIATVLSRLEKRGLVRHRRDGRQYIYHAAVSDRDVQRSMLAELTERVFDGDVTALVSHLITDRELEPDDLSRVKAMIEARERELAGEDDPDDAQ